MKKLIILSVIAIGISFSANAQKQKKILTINNLDYKEVQINPSKVQFQRVNKNNKVQVNNNLKNNITPVKIDKQKIYKPVLVEYSTEYKVYISKEGQMIERKNIK